MTVVQIRMDEFERVAERIGAAADQIPYAASRTLNDAVRAARQVLVQSTWPSSVTVRNASFMNSQLQMVFSNKSNLTVEINNEKRPRAHLKLHADGGKKVGKGRLAVPPPGTKVSGRGLRPSQRPRAIVASTPARALRITNRGIFVGKGGRLWLKFSLLQSATQPKDVPFHEDFEHTVRETVRTGFPTWLATAMGSRR